MKENTINDQMPAYSEAVKSGLYAKKSGLVGKYDNVRRLWEDEITRQFLRSHLHKLADQCRNRMQRVKIMDLGCGSADGYELLMGVRDKDADLIQTEVDLLSPEITGMYTGVDLNKDLLNQAAAIYGAEPKITFRQADFTHGLPLIEGEEPYDLYFSSFGTFSHHNDDKTAIHLLAEIAERTPEYCLVHCDWLGRYSYEWQTLWTNDLSENMNMDYVVSYIYNKEEREAKRNELQHLNLRLMSRKEAENIIAEASKLSGTTIKPLRFYDRSVFVGRHMDTGDYNPKAQPIREAVNSLFETNMRTDLSKLIVDYIPRQGFEFLNRHYELIQMSWNCLVRYVANLLELYDEDQRCFCDRIPALPPACPKPVRDMAWRMTEVVKGTGWYGLGLPRENIIEPQLGFALRHVVTNMQEGQGCGHGLVGIMEIDKRNG